MNTVPSTTTYLAYLAGTPLATSTSVEDPLQITCFLCKTNPISEMAKMNANLYVIEDYENETTFRPQKNKPNSNPISSKAKIACQKIWPQPYPAFRVKFIECVV